MAFGGKRFLLSVFKHARRPDISCSKHNKNGTIETSLPTHEQ